METTDAQAMAGPAVHTTKSRKRPLSRASTSSIQSGSTQPNLEQTFGDADIYSTQWLKGNQAQHKELAPALQEITPEELLQQAASHVQASREFSMDSSVNAGLGHSNSFRQSNPNMSRHSLSGDNYSANNSFADPESQLIERDGNDDGDSVLDGPRLNKAAARSSANNELEMRQLFQANQHRTLPDVASELHGNERGPHSERTRQLFAMIWINQACTHGKGSVPRSRVYGSYADRCGDERITVLNPASFGKLVRVLFPGLKTRRLGVRGESKYHYVNFAILEPVDVPQNPLLPQNPHVENAGIPEDFNFNALPRDTNLQQERAAPGQPAPVRIEKQPMRSQELAHSLYNLPEVASIEQLHSTTGNKTAQKLCFAKETDEPFSQSDPLMLPRIEPFLPEGTDPDAARSLAALYRAHCTSLVECVRYCKEKTFFHLFNSFQGTLTMPVQRLFENPAIAPWIEENDFVLYQRMMRIVAGLTLQVVPKPVLDTLRNISDRLVRHIRESFQQAPLHVVRAKEAPATIFAGLLDRALRVNLTAHAAANMLSNPANRDQMYLDWITTVRLRKLAECVPSRAMDDVVNVLLTELRDLLDPVNIPWTIESLTLHGDVVLQSGRAPQSESRGDSTASNVLDRWVCFLKSLPSKFPYASHTDIVWCVQRIGTSVMRDLTISQGKSFGSWWVTKCWVDEMILFLAGQGGFMTQTRSQSSVELARKQVSSREMGGQGSRFSSGSDDFNLPHVSQSQPDRAPFPSGPGANKQASAGTHDDSNHDDSGIGIRTPEEDFPMEKFGFSQADAQDLMVDNDMHHSMPAI